MFAKSFVDSVEASDPHVALAWTGVCILLPVSIPILCLIMHLLESSQYMSDSCQGIQLMSMKASGNSE
jgi:hypothetical protein